jgi:hypothetical protein
MGEILLLQSWSLIDFLILPLLAGVGVFAIEKGIQRIPQSRRPYARPLALFILSWGLISLANTFGTTHIDANFNQLASLGTSPVIGISNPQSFAHRAGLRTADRILQLNEIAVNTWDDVQREFKTLQEGKIRETDIEIQRGQEKARFRFHIIFTDDEPFAGIEASDLFLEQVYPNKPAATSGLLGGDQIKSINGISLNTWQDAQEFFKKNESTHLEFNVLREGHEVLVSVQHEPSETLGIRTAQLLNPPSSSVTDEWSLVESLQWSVWGVKTIPLLTELPSLNLAGVSHHWFVKDPYARKSVPETIAYYLKLLGIFCGGAVPFAILCAPFITKSSRPRSTLAVKYVFILSLQTLLWLLFTASVDRYFIL